MDMQKVDTWYKAEGYCPAEEFELASYLLFEAGVATLEDEITSTNFVSG